MKLASFEQYAEIAWAPATVTTLRSSDELAQHDEDRRETEIERRGSKARFPHTVIVEGAVDDYDFANRWCWQNVGPCDGECMESYSQYPGCPLVLATVRVESKDGRERKKYSKVEAHSHQGPWTWYFFGKTEYDYGFGEYYFARELDRNRFVAAVPSF